MTTAQASTTSSKLSGKRILITGGNSGIGRAAAEHFVAAGAHVAVSGRNETTLSGTKAALPAGSVVVQADVTDESDLARLFSETVDGLGGLDAVIVNAGAVEPRPFEHADAEHVRRMNDVNYTGAFLTARHAVDHLGEGGSITFITSCLGEMGMPGMAAYSATKAAVRSLVRTLAAEYGPQGIRVNAVSPGPIETPIYGKMGLPEDQLNAMAQQIAQKVPLGRFGKAEEIADAIAYVTGATYMNGAELTVDGGMGQV